MSSESQAGDAGAKDWVDRAEAIRRLKATRGALRKLVAIGRIRVRDMPTRLRYFAPDIDDVASKSCRML